MAERKENNSDFAGRELSISRLLNAPVELVWEVFINPEHIKNWWGPNGFTNTIHKMEVKPGGAWEFIMHGPDGTNYPNKSVFKEVVLHRSIVFEHYAPNFITTINFIAEGEKTLIKWHMLFESKELFESVVKNHKADKGLEQNIEKLDAYLQQKQSNRPVLTITRIFNAPVKLVWKAWTDPGHMAHWWGPKGFTNPVCELDVKPGGAIRIDMTFPDGTAHPMTGTFIEVDEPNKMSFRCFAFFDKAGKNQLEVINTVRFEETEGKTKLTIHAEVIKAIGEAEVAPKGMNQGWNESLDRLEVETGNMINEPFVIERTFNAPIEKVWSAITNKGEMKQWYFDLTDFKPVVGFEFTFTGGNEGRTFVHLCKVTEVVPSAKLTYSWRYQGYEGISHVSWELFAEGNKTRLKLTHTGLESFPVTAHRDFARENFAAGWTHIIGTSLQQCIEK